MTSPHSKLRVISDRAYVSLLDFDEDVAFILNQNADLCTVAI